MRQLIPVATCTVCQMTVTDYDLIQFITHVGHCPTCDQLLCRALGTLVGDLSTSQTTH